MEEMEEMEGCEIERYKEECKIAFEEVGRIEEFEMDVNKSALINFLEDWIDKSRCIIDDIRNRFESEKKDFDPNDFDSIINEPYKTFLRKDVCKAIEILVNVSDHNLDYQVKKVFNSVLLDVVVLVARTICVFDIPELVDSVLFVLFDDEKNIFRCNCRFPHHLSGCFNWTFSRDDDYHGIDSQDDLDYCFGLTPADESVPSSFTKPDSPVSPLYIMSINSFARASGFSSILHRISSSTDGIGDTFDHHNHGLMNFAQKPSFQYVFSLVRAVYHISLSFAMNTEYGDLFANSFYRRVFKFVLGLSDKELKTISKGDLKKFQEQVGKIMEYLLDDSTVRDSAIPDFKLEFSLKLLNSQSLEKKLNGISEIKEVITLVPKAPNLAKWLKEHKVLEILFGSHMHHELVKRSSLIIQTLAEGGLLNTQDLEMMWHAAQDKQDATVEAVFAGIKIICPHLNPDGRKKIYLFLRDLPKDQHDRHSLSLINCLLDTAIIASRQSLYSRQPQDDWSIGLQLLWELVQDSSSLVLDARISVLTNALTSLTSYSSQRNEVIPLYYQKCIDNLASHHYVSQSLALLKQLIKSQSHWFPISTILAHVQEKHKLLDVFLSSFVASESPSICCYLDFLEFLSSTDSSKVSNWMCFGDNLEKMWNCVITRAISQEDRDNALLWFSKQNDQRICKELLRSKFPHMDKLSDAAWECFHNLFRQVNHDQLQYSQDSLTSVQHVPPLEGLETLWKITLFSETSSKVTQMSIDLLNSLYRSPECPVNIRKDYIQRVVSVMTDKSTPQSHFVSRCIRLLCGLVFEYERIHLGGSDRWGFPLTLTIDHKSQRTSISVNSGMTLFALKKSLLSRTIRFPFSMYSDFRSVPLRLIKSGKNFSQWDSTLHELQFKHNDHVFATITPRQQYRAEVELDIEDETAYSEKLSALFKSDSEQTEELKKVAPSTLLSSDPSFFSTMFSFLERFHKSEPLQTHTFQLCTELWNMLCSIPTNPELFNSIAHLHSDPQDNESSCEIDWNQLIDSSSVFALTYSLRIVEELLQNPPTQELPSSKTGFKRSLIQKGGLNHLIQLVVTNQGKVWTSHDYEAIGTLLSVLSSLLLDEDKLDEDAFTDGFRTRDSQHFPSAICSFISQAQTLFANNGHLSLGDSTSRTKTQDVTFLACKLLSAILLAKRPLIVSLIEDTAFVSFLEDCFVKNFQWPERTVMVDFVHKLAHEGGYSISERLETLCFSFLSKRPVSSENYCPELFQLLARLTPDSQSPIQQNNLENIWLTRFQESFSILSTRSIIEPYDATPDQEDNVLTSLLLLIWKLIPLVPPQDELIHLVFHWCLFDLPTIENHGLSEPPACKGEKSRNAAFRVLLAAARRSSDSFKKLLGMLWDLLNPIMVTDSHSSVNWSYSPSDLQRSPLGYVGIKNLGCICYMNSLIQQLFLIPKFRKALLSLECFHPTQREGDELCLICQLHRLFAYLQESRRQFFDPVEFCRANKDADGEPVNVLVQMDVDEYFNILCEKLENSFKRSPQAKLLDHIWGGKVSTQLICKGCPHVYERSDPFAVLPLDIKGQADITQALELFVKGEMLEGENAYHCETCDAKRNTLKRNCIKALPNTLILNLKRFEFNFDLMQKVKLNDYCEFPFTLNMFPYTSIGVDPDSTTSDDRPQSYYDYHLVGILVHRGSSECGHYYSFIKERIALNQSPRWLEFNDKIVLPFDPERIAEECFGGQEEICRYDHYLFRDITETVSKTRNAYLLIYERQAFFPADHPYHSTEFSQGDHEEEMCHGNDDEPLDRPRQRRRGHPTASPFGVALMCAFFIVKLKRTVKKRRSEGRFTVFVPPHLMKEVWDDNTRFLAERLCFDEEGLNFLLQFVTTFNPPNQHLVAETTQFASAVFLNLVLRAKNRSSVAKPFLDHLKGVLNQSPDSCILLGNLLTAGATRDYAEQCLIESPIQETRFFFAEYLFAIMQGLFNDHSTFSGIPPEVVNTESSISLRILQDLITWLSRHLYYMEYKWRFFDAYFELLVHFVQLPDTSRLVSLPSDNLVKFLVLDHDLNGKKLAKRKKLDLQRQVSHWNDLFTLLDLLEPFPDQEIQEKLLSQSFLDTLCFVLADQDDNFHGPAKLIAHTLFNNESGSLFVLNWAGVRLNGLHLSQIDDAECLWVLIETIVLLNDDFMENRVRTLMRQMEYILNYRNRTNPKRIENIMVHLENISDHISCFESVMQEFDTLSDRFTRYCSQMTYHFS